MEIMEVNRALGWTFKRKDAAGHIKEMKR